MEVLKMHEVEEGCFGFQALASKNRHNLRLMSDYWY